MNLQPGEKNLLLRKYFLDTNDKLIIMPHIVCYMTKNCEALVGKQNGKEVDFIAEKNSEKIYIQVALRITEMKTMEREFGNLKAIKDNYPKYVITLDKYTGVSHEGIRHLPLDEFLYNFM